jgi:hypothetical protein
MKKLIIIFVLLSLSCSKDDIKEVVVEPIALDCKCDRIVQVSSYAITGTIENPISYFAILWTINDCTKLQKEFRVNKISNINEIPKVGQCK